MTKKNNHLLPRFVIKRWETNDGKIYEKNNGKTRKVDYYDYSKSYYYSLGKIDDKLENRIANFESYIADILNRINEQVDSIELLEKDMEILKLYAYLQSCRNQNTSSVIISDESMMYQNNEYLFGVPLVSTQDEAVKTCEIICDEFERLKDASDSTKYSYDFSILANDGLNSFLLAGLHLVIVTNESNAFLISETTSIIESSIDSNYLFCYVPISPKRGLILAKSKYFYDSKRIEKTKQRFGEKYGIGIPDPRISEIICDDKLIFKGKSENGKVVISFAKLDDKEIYNFNSIIYEDGKKILFCNEESLNKSKEKNFLRHVVLI